MAAAHTRSLRCERENWSSEQHQSSEPRRDIPTKVLHGAGNIQKDEWATSFASSHQCSSTLLNAPGLVPIISRLSWAIISRRPQAVFGLKYAIFSERRSWVSGAGRRNTWVILAFYFIYFPCAGSYSSGIFFTQFSVLDCIMCTYHMNKQRE